MLRCGHVPCGRPLSYVHGSGVCVNSLCPRWGVKQVVCCEGEVGDRVEQVEVESRSVPAQTGVGAVESVGSLGQRRMWEWMRWHPGGTAYGGVY